MQLIDELVQKLSKELPGIEAQYKMAPNSRPKYKQGTEPDDAVIAAVLFLLFKEDGRYKFLLIERTHHKKDRHSGQISLPGGRYDKTDENIEMTSIREAHEEVGVDQKDIRILGKLTNLYIPASKHIVFPFVGYYEGSGEFKRQEKEVKSILKVDLKTVIEENIIKKTKIKMTDKISLMNVPYYDISGHVVWGATAMMIRELVEVIEVS